MALLRSRAPPTPLSHPCQPPVIRNAQSSPPPPLPDAGPRSDDTQPTTADAAVDTAAPHVSRENDLVIIQEHYTTLKPLVLNAGQFMNNRFGRFSHDDMIGRPIGRRVRAQNPAMTPLKERGAAAPVKRQLGAGFVHALAPTPELWAQAMDHRTQIVYPHDAALVSLLLGLKPGSVLVECGTGSGSASTSFARVVAPHGRVYSFDFHTERANKAIADFKLLGIDHIVHVSPGVDVVKQGFTGVADNTASAVFLDLPMPYEMGPEITRVLKPNARVCLFSPCIEQVQKSVAMLKQHGFHSVQTVTAPVKTYETREMKLETPGFDQLKQCDDHTLGEEKQDGKTDDGVGQHENGKDDENNATKPPPAKRLRSDSGCADGQHDVPTTAATGDTNGYAKSEKNTSVMNTDKLVKLKSRTAGAERLAIGAMDGQGRHVGRVIRPNIRLHSKPFVSMKGHTSYLTFATKCTDFTSGVAKGGDKMEIDTGKEKHQQNKDPPASPPKSSATCKLA